MCIVIRCQVLEARISVYSKVNFGVRRAVFNYMERSYQGDGFSKDTETLTRPNEIIPMNQKKLRCVRRSTGIAKGAGWKTR